MSDAGARALRALVVGGTGFLGLNLVAALQQAGHDVLSTRRRSSNTILARKLKVPLVHADGHDEDALAAAMADRDAVFMMAGHYPRFSVDTEAQVAAGVAGVRTAMQAAARAGVRRFVYTSSVVTVARPAEDRPAVEDDGVAEVPGGSTYFAVKLAMEAEVLERAPAGLEVVVACPTGCMGLYDYKVGTGFFVLGLASGKLGFFVDGWINIVDAADVALGLCAAALNGTPGRRYILGGHNVTVSALLAQMAARFGVAMPTQVLAPAQAIALAEGEEARCVAEGGKGRPAITREMVDVIVHGQAVDSRRARQELAFAPRPLHETIDRAYGWYRDNGYLGRQPRAAFP